MLRQNLMKKKEKEREEAVAAARVERQKGDRSEKADQARFLRGKKRMDDDDPIWPRVAHQTDQHGPVQYNIKRKKKKMAKRKSTTPSYIRKKVKTLEGKVRNIQKFSRTYVPRGGFDVIGARGTDNSRAVFGNTYASANDLQKSLRKATRFRGDGDYFTDLARKYIPSGTFSSIGKSLGGMSGIPGMTAVGAYAGNKLSNLVGFGDYVPGMAIQSNQLIQGGETPITVNASDDLTGDIHMSHREFIGNVVAIPNALGVSPFSSLSYDINPGLISTFPWLSQIAQNYTMYDFEGLIYEYKPNYGEGAGASNALGKVIMATNYDPAAPPFSTATQMESYDYANSCKPSIGMIHGVETANKQTFGNMLYVRTGTTTRDKIFTDIGDFQIATEGIVGTANVPIILGELWVTYRIRLSRANLFGSLLCYNQQMDQHLGVSNGTTLLCGNTQTALPAFADANKYVFPSLTTEWAKRITNTIGTTLTAVGTGNNAILVTFPNNIVDGLFEINIQQNCPAATTVGPNTFVNCSQVLLPATSNFQSLTALPDALSLTNSSTIYIRVAAPGTLVASFQIGLSSGATVVGARSMIKITCVSQKVID